MKKHLFALAIFGLASVTSASAVEPRGTSQPVMSGTTTEVRYTRNLNSKGSKITKLVITRDASGRIISVKRGR